MQEQRDYFESSYLVMPRVKLQGFRPDSEQKVGGFEPPADAAAAVAGPEQRCIVYFYQKLLPRAKPLGFEQGRGPEPPALERHYFVYLYPLPRAKLPDFERETEQPEAAEQRFFVKLMLPKAVLLLQQATVCNAQLPSEARR